MTIPFLGKYIRTAKVYWIDYDVQLRRNIWKLRNDIMIIYCFIPHKLLTKLVTTAHWLSWYQPIRFFYFRFIKKIIEMATAPLGRRNASSFRLHQTVEKRSEGNTEKKQNYRYLLSSKRLFFEYICHTLFVNFFI